MKYLTIEEFAESMRIIIQNSLGEEFYVSIQNTRKNNGVCWNGLMIQSKDKNIAPTIYLESFYQLYLRGADLQNLSERVIDTYWEDMPQKTIDMRFFTDIEKVKTRLCFKLINYEKNEELFEDVPYVPFLDLAICFYYLVETMMFGSGAIQVTNSHLEMWGITKEELYQLAMENTPKLLPAENIPMVQMLRQILTERRSCSTVDEEDELWENLHLLCDYEQKTGLHILTNQWKCNGSAVILYPGFLKGIAEQMEDDLYILPSSVHEVIIIKKNDNEDPEYLMQMIYSVNTTAVTETEVLSNSLYLYSRDKEEVEFVGALIR